MSSTRSMMLAGAAVLLPAAAFAQAPAAGADCDRLILVLEQQKPANAPLTLDQARGYKRANNARGCQEALANPAMAAYANAAQVIVQQATPQVSVQQAQPNVTVNQPQPEITVHQPAPTVTVDIPQPVITVRMAPPQVNVAVAQPQVQVSQAKPEVQVVEAAPAQVSVAGAQPNVTIQNNQQEPKVNYTGEQAKVVVNQAQGAPNVKVEQGDRPAVVAVAPVAGAVAPAAVQAATQPMPASRLLRMNVVNARGDTLGDVERILMQASDNRNYVVIGHGGFLGMGEKQVALPIENMFLRDGKLVMRGMTDDQIRAMPSWSAATQGYANVVGDQVVAVGTGG